MSSSLCLKVYHDVLIVLFLIGQVNSGPGTTPNLKQIVLGRCYNYITLVNPSPRYNCEEIWQKFEDAVVRRTPCNVRVKDYHGMFQVATQVIPCDKMLLWSKTRGFMHNYAAVSGQFWTLEDTLVGFMFNDLIWCGQQERDRGFDFQSCPDWSSCVTHPVYSLWKRASQNFAASACGNITVLLNGSAKNAFSRTSMFGSVELENLNPRMVSHIHIKVVPNLEGPLTESCSKGSILELTNILQSRGFHWSCTDSDAMLMILQCTKNPGQPTCRACSNSLLPRQGHALYTTTSPRQGHVLTTTSPRKGNVLYTTTSPRKGHSLYTTTSPRVSECESIWQAFEQAYVGRDHCDVPPEAYDLLIRRQQQLACSTMLFWSKTMEIAHAFTKNRKCLRTLEHTLLGSMFDHLNWCSKNQSKETFTTGCPDWHSCVNNPKRSFWIRASDNFASTACGNVSAMLNGSLEAPFDSSRTTCENASFKNLKSTLNPNIAYNCKVVPFTRVQDCISNLDIPCGDCLSPRSLG
ncbi:ADP-ribosyl cyclase/cyclic ADP-ribose hydrolase 1 isoform X2 [Brachyhypopomus gauderio]|uniref:ADP-ribosyl cyclase/cyclic ADP-ribose hydrolase 1 isoform X2 n=1 Tax=Brachyhypopomus gauderio TaxID=698409 RepID=UPI004042A6DB